VPAFVVAALLASAEVPFAQATVLAAATASDNVRQILNH